MGTFLGYDVNTFIALASAAVAALGAIFAAIWRVASKLATISEKMTGTERDLADLQGRLTNSEQSVQARLTNAEQSVQARLAKAEESVQARLTKAEESLTKRLMYAEQSLNHRIDSMFTNAVSGIRSYTSNTIAPSRITDGFSEFLGPIERLAAKGNPLSDEELERFNEYRNKVTNAKPLSEEELTDFKQLGEKIKSELPTEEERAQFSSFLSDVFDFAGGVVMASLMFAGISKKEKDD